MTQGVELVIANLQTKSKNAGCADAPNYAVDQLGQTPFSLAFEGSGTTEFISAGFAKDFATVIVQHHVSHNITPKDIAKAAALRDPFLKAIRDDPQLGSTCDTVTSVKRRFGAMKLGTLDTIGYQYEITVKIDLAST